MNNQLRVSVIGIGQHGTEALNLIKAKSTLPFCYDNTTSDCLVIVSALENQEVAEAIIEIANTDQLVIVIALRSESADFHYFKWYSKIQDHCSVIMRDIHYYDTNPIDSKYWHRQYEFASQILNALFSPFYQRNLFGLDFFELQAMFKKGMLAFGAYYKLNPNNIKHDLARHIKQLKQSGLKLYRKSKVMVNVVQQSLNLNEFDAVTAYLFDAINSVSEFDALNILSKFDTDRDITVCNTTNPKLSNHIGLCLIISHQEINMNIKQRDALSDLFNHTHTLNNYSRRLDRSIRTIIETFEHAEVEQDFTDQEIEKLVNFNQRLIEVEQYLVEIGTKESEALRAKLADTDSNLYDFEIEARLNFILATEDPEYDEDSDNILTTRILDIKRLDDEWGIGDMVDHKDPIRQYPQALDNVRHCYLLKELTYNSYGLDQMKLSLANCLKIGEIHIDVQVIHQSAMSVDDGSWLYRK